MTLLGQAPEGTERHALEITLATLRGVSATHVLGISSPEAKSAFQRAYSLLADIPEHLMRGRLLHGFGFVLSLRADYAEALAVAERAEALSSTSNDPVLVLVTCIVHGYVEQLQGRSRAARTWIERGLEAAELLELAPVEIFVADPQVTLLGLLGINLLHSGFVEQGRARLERAQVRARLLGWPMTRLAALWYDALFEVRLGNTERVAALADEMRALVDEFEVAQGRNACRWFRGWADARMGRPREGYRRIREAYEDNTRLGMLAGGSEVLGYAAEALVLAGDWDAAQHELEEALQFVNTHGERVYLPQLFLLEAAIARARGESAVAQRFGSAGDRRGQSAGGAVARVDGAARALRIPRSNGRRPAGACRTRRSASRSDRHNCCYESASPARPDEASLNDARVNGRFACRMGLVTRCCQPGTLGRWRPEERGRERAVPTIPL